MISACSNQASLIETSCPSHLKFDGITETEETKSLFFFDLNVEVDPVGASPLAKHGRIIAVRNKNAIGRQSLSIILTSQSITCHIRTPYMVAQQFRSTRNARAPFQIRVDQRRESPVNSVVGTSSAQTKNLSSMCGPNDVVIAQSAASRPVAIKIQPILRMLCRASNVYQRPPR